MPLLDVQGLTTRFAMRGETVHAVEDVSFVLEEGEVLGVVGESGSGKSVMASSLLRLLPMPPAQIAAGQALLQTESGPLDLLQLSEREIRRVRGREIGMIFQDPMTSLNPYLRLSTQLTEGLRRHYGLSKRAAIEQAIEALERVGISDAAKRIHSHPHEFSGGMRQRVMIAMMLLLQPRLLIADEPTTALDVTVQRQILDQLGALCRDARTAVLLITHDLGVVAQRCHRVMVMYAGQVMEIGPSQVICEAPRHPYTQALLRARPSASLRGQPLYALPGNPPDLREPPVGDPLLLRPGVTGGDRWRTERPPLEQVGAGHWVRASEAVLPAWEEVRDA
ncbi:MAG: peptide/nickel transport system ATP-binding protein [Puniceicoccaceae bacterium 5H]|nr:MAG: peptide/nickel transport system ATP-binding protein [Puniceicoccaceae bacterium 5H]